MPTKKITAIFLLSKIVSDRHQYKPYISELASPLEAPIYVEVDVPENCVTGNKPLVITVDGLAAILNNVATATDKMHDEYVKSIVKR